MNYEFPVIQHINDVLPAIEGDASFAVTEKEDLIFINYRKMGTDVFPEFVMEDSENRLVKRSNLYAALRRECRGIAFSAKTGEIVSRPFHKFFNADERESTTDIDISGDHMKLEKLDGSMIRPLIVNGELRWGTKAGVTDVGMLAETWVTDYPQYEILAHACIFGNVTPLFEFCSEGNKIVLDYAEPHMTLLALRCNHTGEYLPYKNVRHMAHSHNIPVVRPVAYVHADADTQSMLDVVRGNYDVEGIVIVFPNGHMVKVKSSWYVKAHRAKDLLASERNVLKLLRDEELDDILPVILVEDRNRLEDYVDSFNFAVQAVGKRVFRTYLRMRDTYETKKDFALSGEDMSGLMRSAVFSLWDIEVHDHDLAGVAWAEKAIFKSLSTEDKFNETKAVLGLHTGWENLNG